MRIPGVGWFPGNIRFRFSDALSFLMDEFRRKPFFPFITLAFRR